MAIEKDLKRIADALEALVSAGGLTLSTNTAPAAPKAEAAPAAPKAEAAPAAPKAEAAPAALKAEAAPAALKAEAAPAAPAPELKQYTSQELNEILVAEFKRLGSRDPIDKAMKDLGINGVANLTDPVKQKELVDAVQGLQV